MHTYHEALPGFSPEQLAHDGCAKCEERGKDPARLIQTMDMDTFRRAWERSIRHASIGCRDESHAELATLHVLAAVRVKLKNDPELLELLLRLEA